MSNGISAKTKAGRTPFLVRYLSGLTHFRVGPYFKLRQASFLQCRGGSGGRLPSSDWKLDGEVNVRHVKNFGQLKVESRPDSPTLYQKTSKNI